MPALKMIQMNKKEEPCSENSFESRSRKRSMKNSRFPLLLVCATALLGSTPLMSQTPTGVEKQFPQPQVIRYDGHCLTINTAPIAT